MDNGTITKMHNNQMMKEEDTNAHSYKKVSHLKEMLENTNHETNPA